MPILPKAELWPVLPGLDSETTLPALGARNGGESDVEEYKGPTPGRVARPEDPDRPGVINLFPPFFPPVHRNCTISSALVLAQNLRHFEHMGNVELTAC
jgi:hypothetical protein